MKTRFLKASLGLLLLAAAGLSGYFVGVHSITDNPSEVASIRSNSVKRVVAMPGDIVEVRAGVVYVNGQPQKPGQR